MSDEDHKSVFTKWLEQHSSAVIKVARAYTLNEEECRDLAQEILLQAWKSLPRFSGASSPATWFYRVALHTAMNWKRHDATRLKWHPLIMDVQTPAASVTDSVEVLQHREMVEQLYKAIQQLPKAHAALVLLYLDDLSYREIADVLGISENHVGVKLNRAKKALATLMNGASDGT